jgi:hypothetical protein
MVARLKDTSYGHHRNAPPELTAKPEPKAEPRKDELFGAIAKPEARPKAETKPAPKSEPKPAPKKADEADGDDEEDLDEGEEKDAP